MVGLHWRQVTTKSSLYIIWLLWAYVLQVYTGEKFHPCTDQAVRQLLELRKWME